MNKEQIPISRQALIKRINRVLAKRPWAEKLHTSRGWREKLNLGDYYRIDVYRNCVVDHHVDLEELGVDLEVLLPQELLAD